MATPNHLLAAARATIAYLRQPTPGTSNMDLLPPNHPCQPFGRDESDDERHQRMLHEAHKALIAQHTHTMRRMALMNFLAVSCVAFALIANIVGGFLTRSDHAERIQQLSEQVHRLERIKHYAGKDVDGNEVWQASVTEVNLNNLNNVEKP